MPGAGVMAIPRSKAEAIKSNAAKSFGARLAVTSHAMTITGKQKRKLLIYHEEDS